MACTTASDAVAGGRRGRSGRFGKVFLWGLLVGTAGAQAPVVPTGRYGPPVCVPGQAPAPRMTVEAAQAEQETGAQDARAITSAEPLQNFALARYKLADYADCVVDSVCYWADLDTQYKRAETALADQVMKAKAGQKLAIVMDIDETTLSSYCEMKREDFGYIGPMYNGWIVGTDAAVAIPGALRLFQRAQAAGVAVFFITGRPETQTAATARNLEAAGFHRWNGLALRVGPENQMGTAEYKSAERRKIETAGYRIALSVGDQWSDLLGEPEAAVSVKLPNPFYFLPSKNP